MPTRHTHASTPDVDSFPVGDLNVRIVFDTNPMNPRGWSNLGKISMKADHWTDDDAISADSNEEFWRELCWAAGLDAEMEKQYETFEETYKERKEYWAEEHGYSYIEAMERTDYDAEEKMRQWCMEKATEHFLVLPIYVYKHSGIKMQTMPFSSPWDSGHGGYIYISYEDLVELTPPEDREREDWAIEILEGEVETFSNYVNGEVYGYKVETEEGVHLDSCYGFFDLEYCKEEARRSAKHHTQD